MTCDQCQKELQIGDWPFCNGTGKHDSIYPQSAQHFDPVVLHQAPDGSYSFPAATDAPVRPGYRKVEIRTIQEADRVTREVNSRSDSELRAVQAQSDTNRSATRARNRALVDQMAARMGMSAAGRQFRDQWREYVAQKDQRRENSRPRSTNFHIDVFANDSSNRDQYRDERTGWRGRKG